MQVRLFSRKQVDIAAASGVEEAGVKVPTSVLLFLYLDPDHDTRDLLGLNLFFWLTILLSVENL